jgi:hypothetical protein
MKNYLWHTVALAVSALALLLILGALPAPTIGGHHFRRVDMLSDIRATPEESSIDSVPLPPKPVVKPAFVDTCATGITCIEDFSDSTARGMTAFYRALEQVKNRPVRIAYFGDSFIEADILTADLREMLQKRYGGGGAGWVDIVSATYGFRPTVRHAFEGWESHSVHDTIDFHSSLQGINSRYFLPSPNAYVQLRGQTKYASRLDTCASATLYFYTRGITELMVAINGASPVRRTFAPSDELQSMTIDGRIGSVRWTVERADSAVFFGAALDEPVGIALDNFAVRASAGMNLQSIPSATLRDFERLRPYDLIVLQFGLNAVTPTGARYDSYQRGMTATIEYLKALFPQTAFLLISIGDRDYKTDTGELRTMPGVKNLLRYQEHIAAATGIAFWNLYEAMGGEGSMAKLVEAEPPMANYDYTHINFRGGKHIATLLYNALTYGKEQFDRKEAYDKR